MIKPLDRNDYREDLPADMWAFIETTESFDAPIGAGLDIAKERAHYDAMCRHFHRPYPDGVTAQDEPLGPARLRAYQVGGGAGDAAILYLHGGAFMLGGLDSHDAICADICAATGLRLWALDYRLVPEHSVEDAVEDAQAALAHLRGQGVGRIVLVGDSAGAFLAAKLCETNRDAADLAGQVLYYPGLGGPVDTASMQRQANAPLLTAASVIGYRKTFAGRPAAPLEATRFDAVPPTLALGAECDPLADEAPLYAEAIRQAGGVAVGVVESGLVHGHLRARHHAKVARASFDRGVRAIAAMAAGPLTQAGLEKIAS